MKAKHIIALTGILLFFTGSVFVLHKALSALQQKEEQYATIPVFYLSDLGDEMVSNTSIDQNQATLFYFFDPECNLCHTIFDSLKIRGRCLSKKASYTCL
jgi:Protein-disulfide isomerase